MKVSQLLAISERCHSQELRNVCLQYILDHYNSMEDVVKALDRKTLVELMRFASSKLDGGFGYFHYDLGRNSEGDNSKQ
jgi:hypothetical protein